MNHCTSVFATNCPNRWSVNYSVLEKRRRGHSRRAGQPDRVQNVRDTPIQQWDRVRLSRRPREGHATIGLKPADHRRGAAPACLQARNAINQICYGGGDSNHRSSAASYLNLEAIIVRTENIKSGTNIREDSVKIRTVVFIVVTTVLVNGLARILDVTWVRADPPQTATRELQLEKLVIVDKNGNKQIEMTAGEFGPMLTMFEPNSKGGIEIGFGKGPNSGVDRHIIMRGATGSDDVWMQSRNYYKSEESCGSLSLATNTQRGAVELGVSPSGESSLRLTNGEQGAASLLIEHRPNTGSFIFEDDNMGKVRMIIGVAWKDQRYIMEMNDRKGKPVWQAYDNDAKKKLKP